MIATFIYQRDNLVGENIVIGGEEGHHIARVMRLKSGDQVRLIDGQGTAHTCEIGDIKGDQVVCRIIKTTRFSGEPSIKLTLAVALSEAAKFKTIIEKGTEVGVSKFIPLYSEKSKINLSASAIVKRKMSRWQRIATAAAKQSGRSVIPTIDQPEEFSAFIKRCNPEVSCLFHSPSQMSLTDLVSKTSDLNEVVSIIGPESGFSPTEIELAGSNQVAVVSLGDRILRTETAGVVIPSLIIYLRDAVKKIA